MSSDSDTPDRDFYDLDTYTLAWPHSVKSSKAAQAKAMESMNQFKLVGPMLNNSPSTSGAASNIPSNIASSPPGAMASTPCAPPPHVPPAPVGEAPPPYTTMPRPPGPGEIVPWTGPGAIHGGYVPGSVKLGYMDFVPRLVRKRVLRDNEYEPFE